MLLSVFDYLILVLCLIFNILVLRFDFLGSVKPIWVVIGWFFLFAGVLPLLSIGFEKDLIQQEYEVVDGFNLVYLLFKFPLYWGIGWVELLLLALIGKFRNRKVFAD